MFSRVEACRAISRAAMAQNVTAAAVSPSTERAIAAKTFCTETAVEVTSSALGLFGGDGLKRGSLVEKLFRDARSSVVGYGSNDVLALVGARRLLDDAARVPTRDR